MKQTQIQQQKKRKWLEPVIHGIFLIPGAFRIPLIEECPDRQLIFRMKCTIFPASFILPAELVHEILFLVKFIFTAGLLVPCVFDVLGIGIRDAYSLIMVGLIIVVSVYYEYRIITELRNIRDNK